MHCLKYFILNFIVKSSLFLCLKTGYVISLYIRILLEYNIRLLLEYFLSSILFNRLFALFNYLKSSIVSFKN